jgi:hypothetical protein
MTRAFFITSGFCLLLGACTQRTICPAFQSAFIYDKDALRKKFSYFQEDSTPKVLMASKNKYLIAEVVPYRKRLSNMATVEMKDVFPVVPDSLTMDEDVSLAELDRAARSVIDSTYIVDVPAQPVDTLATDDSDSVYVISRDREVRMLRYDRDSVNYKVDEVRFNIDQDNYMWYLRDALVLPDVRLAQMQNKWDEESAVKETREEKRGFFRNLFRKKEKKEEGPVDTLQTAPDVERSEFDFEYTGDDVQEEEPEVQPEARQRKGLFSFLKKDKTKEAKTSNGPGEQPKKKKEKKPKKEKVPKGEQAEPEGEKPEDDEVKGDEGF